MISVTSKLTNLTTKEVLTESDSIDAFVNVLNCSRHEAKFYLESSMWIIETAVMLWLENHGNGGGNYGTGTMRYSDYFESGSNAVATHQEPPGGGSDGLSSSMLVGGEGSLMIGVPSSHNVQNGAHSLSGSGFRRPRRGPRFVPRDVTIDGLPAGWIAKVSRHSGHVYFVERSTGLTQYSVPPGFADVSEEDEAYTGGRPDGTAATLGGTGGQVGGGDGDGDMDQDQGEEEGEGERSAVPSSSLYAHSMSPHSTTGTRHYNTNESSLSEDGSTIGGIGGIGGIHGGGGGETQGHHLFHHATSALPPPPHNRHQHQQQQQHAGAFTLGMDAYFSDDASSIPSNQPLWDEGSSGYSLGGDGPDGDQGSSAYITSMAATTNTQRRAVSGAGAGTGVGTGVGSSSSALFNSLAGRNLGGVAGLHDGAANEDKAADAMRTGPQGGAAAPTPSPSFFTVPAGRQHDAMPRSDVSAGAAITLDADTTSDYFLGNAYESSSNLSKF
jgi:hypothetical protein